MQLQKLLNAYLTPSRRSNAPSLASLRRRAAKHGVTIERERDAAGWAYWLQGTGWDDGNFCADREELANAVADLEIERAAH